MNPDPAALNAALAADEGFRTEFLAAQSHEQAVEIAARKGWTVTAAEIEAIGAALKGQAADELSEAELENISGGRMEAQLNSRSVNPIVVSRDRALNG